MFTLRTSLRLFCSVTLCAVAAQPASARQQLEASTCPQLDLAASVDTLVLHCARVTVAQSRRLDAASDLVPVQLDVVIFRRRDTPLDATPLVYLAGGPGESALDDVAANFLDTPTGRMIVAQRPIVAFDQRGFSGKSRTATPWLGGLRSAAPDTAPLTTDQLFSLLRAVGGTLRTRGIDLRNFNSIEAAADVVDVLRALGFQRAILFGTSYGTRVALHVMAEKGVQVESAILDAVVPPRAADAFDIDSANVIRRRALERLVDDCRDDARCRALYPKIGQQWSRLARTGSFVEIEAHEAGGRERAVVQGENLLAVLGAALVYEQYRVAAPAILAELSAGRLSLSTAGGSVIPAALHLASGVTSFPSYGLGYLSVVCSEAPMGLPQYGGEAMCRALGVPFGGDPFIRPVRSDAPVLLLAARYDSQSRPEWAELAAKTLPAARIVHFPGIGHVAHEQRPTRECTAHIVAAFLVDPAAAPTAPCLETIGPPSFLDPIVARSLIEGRATVPAGAANNGNREPR
jgi:pimeloyl-ACP methyl ester carboxylesterase